MVDGNKSVFTLPNNGMVLSYATYSETNSLKLSWQALGSGLWNDAQGMDIGLRDQNGNSVLFQCCYRSGAIKAFLQNAGDELSLNAYDELSLVYDAVAGTVVCSAGAATSTISAPFISPVVAFILSRAEVGETQIPSLVFSQTSGPAGLAGTNGDAGATGPTGPAGSSANLENSVLTGILTLQGSSADCLKQDSIHKGMASSNGNSGVLKSVLLSNELALIEVVSVVRGANGSGCVKLSAVYYQVGSSANTLVADSLSVSYSGNLVGDEVQLLVPDELDRVNLVNFGNATTGNLTAFNHITVSRYQISS